MLILSGKGCILLHNGLAKFIFLVEMIYIQGLYYATAYLIHKVQDALLSLRNTFFSLQKCNFYQSLTGLLPVCCNSGLHTLCQTSLSKGSIKNSDNLEDKKDKYKKNGDGHITKAEYQQIAQICKNEVRKARTQNELRLVTNVKNNKVSFNM